LLPRRGVRDRHGQRPNAEICHQCSQLHSLQDVRHQRSRPEYYLGAAAGRRGTRLWDDVTRDAVAGIVFANQKERKAVKFRKSLVVATAISALPLAACSTLMAPSIVNVTAANTPPANSLAGTYLAGNFAAAQGDLKAATNFYSSTLKDAPDNADLLERTFLFAAEGGDLDRAIALSS